MIMALVTAPAGGLDRGGRPAAHGGADAGLRDGAYRLAAVPGLLLLGAYGLWEFWSFLDRARVGAGGFLCLRRAWRRPFASATPPADAALWSLDYYNTGIKAMDQGDYPTARHDLETAYRYVPDNSEVNFALGLLWQQQGDAEAGGDVLLACPGDQSPPCRRVEQPRGAGQQAEGVGGGSPVLCGSARYRSVRRENHYLHARAYCRDGPMGQRPGQHRYGAAVEPGPEGFPGPGWRGSQRGDRFRRRSEGMGFAARANLDAPSPISCKQVPCRGPIAARISYC